MGATRGFGHDAVDYAQALQLLCADLHRLGRIGRFFRGAPQYRRAAFGRNDGIDRMFEHYHAFGAGQRHRPARAALTHNHRDHGHR